MHEYKLGTGCDCNLIPIKMYRMLFLQTNIDELNKSIERKKCCMLTILHVYHNWVNVILQQLAMVLMQFLFSARKWMNITVDARQ